MKNGLGNLTLTEANNFTGSIRVYGGTLRLSQRGSLPVAASSILVKPGATLALDDTGTHSSDRLPDNQAGVTLTGGSLTLLGNGSLATEEVIKDLALDTGGVATVTLTPGAGQSTILRIIGSVTRTLTNSTLFRGTSLGVNAPGTANSASVVLNNAAGSSTLLIGGGGPAGSSAVSIVGGAFGDTTSTGLGTQLVTYDLDRGIRLLDPSTEYTTTLTNGSIVADNVKADNAAISLTAATTANALWLNNGGSVTGAGTLTLTSGTILATGTGNTISAPIAAPAGTVLAIGGFGDLAISTIGPAVTGGIVKQGSGTLTLATANGYTGLTTIAAGVVAIGHNQALSFTAVRFLGGEIRATTPLSIADNITLSGTMTVGGSQDLTFNGTVALDSATRTINVTNTATTTITGVISGSTVPGIGLIKDGPGLLVLTGNNNYGKTDGIGGASGAAYYLSETDVNGGGLRVNGQTGTNSGTGGSILRVNIGAKLSGNGQIIPAQMLEADNLVTVAGGGTLSPGAGEPGILTIGSGVTPGITTATVNFDAGSRFSFLYTGTPANAAPNTGLSLTAGTGNNELVVAGSLTFSSSTVFALNGNFANFNPANTYSFLIATATSVASFNVTSLAQFDVSNFSGYSAGVFAFEARNVSNNVYLNFTAVPEPGSAGLLLAGALMVFSRCGRRMVRSPRDASPQRRARPRCHVASWFCAGRAG